MYHSKYYFKKDYCHVLVYRLSEWDTPFSYIFVFVQKHYNAMELWVVKFNGVLFCYPNYLCHVHSSISVLIPTTETYWHLCLLNAYNMTMCPAILFESAVVGFAVLHICCNTTYQSICHSISVVFLPHFK
jgi:hypothetical protein